MVEIFGPRKVAGSAIGVYSIQSSPNTSFYWNITGGSQVTGGNSSTIVVKWDNASAGEVSVYALDGNGCHSDTISIAVEVTSSVQAQQRMQVLVHPNPNPGEFSIQGTDIETAINIYDGSGRLVFSSVFDSAKDLRLDLRNLDTGVYYMHMDTEAGSFYTKLLIQK